MNGRSPRQIALVTALGAGLVVASGLSAFFFLSASRSSPGAHRPVPGEKPSIVLILTDDQRVGTLWAMPNVSHKLIDRGIWFVNGFVDDPLCCPSRSSILTGNYVHRTGVWSNRTPFGGFPKFHDRSTVATWLHSAGYRTALFGKYLNQYGGKYVPPGWDEWNAFSGMRHSFYYNYWMNVNGKLTSFGRDPSDYSTSLLASRAASFIRTTPGPLFVYFAPYAPHLPTTPAPADEDSFRHLTPWRPPGYDEADVSGKPAWVRRLSRLTPDTRARIEDLRTRTYQSLQAVDRGVGQLMDALAATGRLHNTLIVFMSDNGYSWGEHRWIEKEAPYEEDIRVPFVVRYDRLVGAPRKDHHLVVNIDVAPTFGAVAGARVPATDGRSLLPLLKSPRPPWRSHFLVESMKNRPIPSYCEIRADRYAFIEYGTGEQELYDLRRDPHELDNRARDPLLRRTLVSLHADLTRLCHPPPPKFHRPP